jgi:hypothetical protein
MFLLLSSDREYYFRQVHASRDEVNVKQLDDGLMICIMDDETLFRCGSR